MLCQSARLYHSMTSCSSCRCAYMKSGFKTGLMILCTYQRATFISGYLLEHHLLVHEGSHFF